MSKTLPLQDLNDDLAGALQAAEDGTVFIIDDADKPSYVLLSYPAWQALASGSPSILDRICQKDSDGESVEFDPEPARITIKPAEF